MAGHARYTALLDACVLYPVAMTDALLSLATAGFFAAKWTTLIETEWTRSLERQRPDLIGKLDAGRQRSWTRWYQVSCEAPLTVYAT